ncbi:MAG: glycosyltransferase family 4 protein [Lentisphaerae bacterium]|nr:glycosyltransferase family 4 protein [Lentisphaerota bacterium]
MSEAQRPPLTVCTLIESYYPVVGGMETQARNLAGALNEAGVKVVFVTRRSSRDTPRHELVDGAPVWRCGPAGSSTRLRWAMCLTCIPLLIAKRKEFDIIFVPGFRALGLTAVLMGRLLRKPCILKAESSGEMSGGFFGTGLKRAGLNPAGALVRTVMRLRNRLLAKATAFVSMSSDMTAEFIAGGVRADLIHLIPQTVNVERFSEVDSATKHQLRERLGLPLESLIVTYTGRLVSYKGVLSLARAWTRIHAAHPTATLVFVGEGSADVCNCEAELQTLVRDHGLTDCVRFTGAIDHVEEYLQTSDILAFPTENEAFGISLIEGMACGLAAISTPIGGIKDILTDGDNGLIVEAGHTVQLEDALLRLLGDAELRAAIGARGVASVHARYTWKIVAGLYVDLLESCRRA